MPQRSHTLRLAVLSGRACRRFAVQLPFGVVLLSGPLAVAAPARELGVVGEAARIPRDSTGALAKFLREHDAEFRVVFDSLLANGPSGPPKAGIDLAQLAAAHAAATHDSLLARDVRTVSKLTAPARAAWWRGVRSEVEARQRYGAGDFAGSVAPFSAAASAYAATGDLRREAVILGSLGLAYWNLHDWAACRDAFLRALERRQRLGDRLLIGRAYRSLGLVEENLGRPEQALANFRAALEVRAVDGDRVWDGKTLVYLARDLIRTGQLQAADNALQRAGECLSGHSSASDQCELLLAQAELHLSLGELDTAIEVYRRIEQLEPAPSRLEMSSVHQSLGIALQRRGDYALALQELREAKQVQAAASDDFFLARTCTSLGVLFLETSQFDAARAEFLEAIAAAQRSKNTGAEVEANLNLAELARREGHTDEMKDIVRHVSGIATANGDSALVRDVLFFKGGLAEEQRQWEAAVRIYRDALTSLTKSDPSREIDYRLHIAECLTRLGQYAESRAELRQAVTLATRAQRPDLLWKNLLGIADAYEREGALDSARVYNARAIETLESLRRQDLVDARRVGLMATQGLVYQAQIEVLRKLALKSHDSKWLAEAFDVAERFKGRGLLDLLLTAGAADTSSATRPSEQELRKVDRALTMERSAARRFANLGTAADSLSAIGVRIQRLVTQRAEILDRMRLENPHFATMHTPEPLALREIQRTLLPRKDTVLLEYCLVDSAAYLFTVSSNSVRLDRLPARAVIDSCVHVYRTLLQDPTSGGEGFAAISRRLTRLILSPAREAVRRSHRVLIVADGSLALLPFESLFADDQGRGRRGNAGAAEAAGGATSTRGERGVKLVSEPQDPAHTARHQPFPVRARYALRDQEVSYGPSAAVLAVLARERPAASAGDPRQELLAIGRPAFNPPESASDSTPARVRGEMAFAAELQALPFSGAEVESIGTLFPVEQRTLLLDREASETTITAPGYLGRYRILHFATHAIVDDSNPERSRLVLSFPKDASEDGFLYASELYEFKTRADLVVLSACETGVGRIAAGEGVLGLPRAFFFAGATNVVVSLWSVADESTSHFMQAFYRSLVRDGSDPVAALSRARKALQSDGRYAHPYYWAPFVLQGPGTITAGPATGAQR